MMIRGPGKKTSRSAVRCDRLEIVGPLAASRAGAARPAFIPPAAPRLGDQGREVGKPFGFGAEKLVLLEERHQHVDTPARRLVATRHAGDRAEEPQELRRG